MDICSECGQHEAKVFLEYSPEESLHLCWDCHNDRLAEEMGLILKPFRNGIYKYTGPGNNKHQFYIHRMLLPMGISYKASEQTRSRKPGFEISVTGELDCDQDTLFARLDAKIRSTILNPYLEAHTNPAGQKRLNIRNDEVAGYFLNNNRNNGTYEVVIDGQVFTWEEFGQMMEPYEGFQFKLKILDPYDDVK